MMAIGPFLRGERKKRGYLWLVLAVFFLTVLFINPFRETAIQDDWAYALTVKQLLDTGTFHLHDWLAANMPFQAYWGALFALVGGYNFTTLRLSALVLAFFGLIAFYYLAKEHGLDDTQAGLLTLCLLASPLVLRLSFSFMTDVPFLAGTVAALLFYTRALRLRSYQLMLLGSLAASAAILTRQFGMALIGGLFFLWLLGKERKVQLPLLLVGLALPMAAMLWQIAAGTLTPNLGARVNTNGQLAYFADLSNVLLNVLFRPAIFLNYLALYTLPPVIAILLAIVFFRRGLVSRAWPRRRLILGHSLIALVTLYSLAGVAFWHSIIWNAYWDQTPWLMPYMNYSWWFHDLELSDNLVRGAVTLLTLIGAILIVGVLGRRYFGEGRGQALAPGERLLDLTSLFFLLSQLVFWLPLDEYLFPLIPLVLIAFGRHLGPQLNRLAGVTLAVSLVLLIGSALWTRGIISYDEAGWRGGEYLRALGVEPSQVSGLSEWNSYYGFEEWWATQNNVVPQDWTDYTCIWPGVLRDRAQFLVTTDASPPDGEVWETLTEIPFRDSSLRELQMYVVRIVSRED